MEKEIDCEENLKVHLIFIAFAVLLLRLKNDEMQRKRAWRFFGIVVSERVRSPEY